ncbi:MAG: hypothetical protein ACQEUZ_00780 [Pseudomonadota bacterium]
MAFSHPEVYLTELARPLCDRFKSEPTSYDLAISSCIILYHFADVVAHVSKKTPHDVAIEIAEKIPQFDIIRAIANAGKHVELTRHPKSEFVGLRAEHLVMGSAAAFSDGVYFSDGATFSEMPDTVVVETPDGEKHDVLQTCMSVLGHIERHREFFEV